MEVAQVNIPVAILIWLMIYPMMVQVDFSSIRKAGKNTKGLVVTLTINWLIKPFTMAIFAVIFLKYLFSAFINPSLSNEYVAGAILLGAAPCTAMVFVWSYLTKGDPAYTLIQVAVNDLVILIAFVPIVKFLLGVNQITVPYDTLIYSTIFFVVIPLVTGYISRKYLLKTKGTAWFENVFLKALKPVTIFGLLFTLIILFAFQGHVMLQNPLHIFLIGVPLTVQTYFIFFLGYLWAKKWHLKQSIAAPAAMIGASNFFELSVALAISIFGLKSGAVLATVVGVLVEVPIMLSLVKFSNITAKKFDLKSKLIAQLPPIEKKHPLWEKMVIATDLSEASDKIISYIVLYGRFLPKEAKLVHVISVESAGGLEKILKKKEKSIIEKQEKELKAAGIVTSYDLSYGIPFVEINRIIADEGYKLLVLSAYNKQRAKILLGSISDSIISNIKIPTLLIKCPEFKSDVCRSFSVGGNILFPTDFSDNALTAFEVMVNVASQLNSKVTLYHVHGGFFHRIPMSERNKRKRLAVFEKVLSDYGIKEVKTKISKGNLKTTLIREINSNRYDLVIMGTRGKSLSEGILISDIAHAVAWKSNTSILFVPYIKS